MRNNVIFICLFMGVSSCKTVNRASEVGKVYILGEVKRPGVYLIYEGTSLADVLNQAVLTGNSAFGRIRVQRKVDGNTIEVRVSRDKEDVEGIAREFTLRDGDVLIIPDWLFSPEPGKISVAIKGPFYILSTELN